VLDSDAWDCVGVEADTVQDQFAFVGLGEMGKRMATNLAKHLAQSGQVSLFICYYTITYTPIHLTAFSVLEGHIDLSVTDFLATPLGLQPNSKAGGRVQVIRQRKQC
jgi:hypothetical protein